MDYDSGPYNVTFSSGQINATIMISIKDDEILEVDNENFMVTINNYSPSLPITIGDPGNATVTIVDNDSKQLTISLLCITYRFTDDIPYSAKL